MNIRPRVPLPGWIALLPCLLLTTLGAKAQEDVEAEFEVPPWYQVEIIIFTQKANYGDEAPPRHPELSFPENWVELFDPNAPIPELEEPEQTSFSDDTVAEDSLADVLEELQQEVLPDEKEVSGIQLEEPFVLLDAELRSLNESAAAMDRRDVYDVLLHAAWRQPVLGEEQDPWVIIKAGTPFAERYPLEGSIRITKSRFAHFQANLWLLDFATDMSVETLPGASESELYGTDDSGSGLRFQLTDQIATEAQGPTYIELPDYPVRPEPEPELDPFASATDEVNIWGDVMAPDPQVDTVQGLDSPPGTTSETSAEDVAEVILEPYSGLTDEFTLTEPAPLVRYPVNAVWVMQQSRRMDEERVSYLDHPQMGILVQITPHVPEIVSNTLDMDPEGENATNVAPALTD